MQRLKTLQIDNLSITIRSFTMKEAEELVGKPITLEVICQALTNEKNGEWTVDKLKGEFDSFTVTKLRQEILDLSGMAIEAKPTGEIKAAAPASVNSAAA